MQLIDTEIRKILVVEDSETQRMVLVELLRQMGISEVLEAADGEIALELLRKNPIAPDVVITDLEMPNMDGVALVSQLAGSNLCKSVIVVSAYEDSLLSSVKTLCEEAGLPVLGVLQKPYNVAGLGIMLSNYSTSVTVRRPGKFVPPRAEIPLEEILLALQNKEFGLFYQPKVDAKTHQCMGVEALVRWFSPSRGMVAPFHFIYVLEAKGLMDELTRQVLQIAAEQALRWKNLGREIPISVNLSAQNLVDESLVEHINQLVRSKGLHPSVIVFEVTESSVIDNPVVALGTLARLRLRGFGLSIDDYGTGFSSMSQLSRIPFTEMKLDRSLVHEAHSHPERRVILESAVEMAKRLRLKIVAEGVEVHEDSVLVRELGCDFIQGYYFSKPLSPEDFEKKFLIDGNLEE